MDDKQKIYNQEIKKLNKLFNNYASEYKHLYKELYKEIKQKYNEYSSKMDLSTAFEKAVDEAFANKKVYQMLEDIIANICVQSIFIGAQLPVKLNQTLVTKILYAPYTKDTLTLSQRLHALTNAQTNKVKNIVTRNIRKGQSMKQLAMRLFDGYNTNIRNINEQQLPKYLNTLISDYRSFVSQGLLTTQQLNSYKRAVLNVQKLSKNGTTNALKSAYEQLLKTTNDSNKYAIDKAIWVAVQEKTRYLTDRIARTEMIRAYTDGVLIRNQADNDVVGYRLITSTGHKDNDICDEYVNKNVCGLGKGIYPKNLIPNVPLHCHCMCLLLPVYQGEIDLANLKNNDVLYSALITPQSRIKPEEIK